MNGTDAKATPAGTEDPDPEPESPGFSGEIDVLCHGTAWDNWPVAPRLAEATARLTLGAVLGQIDNALKAAELCVLLTDDAEQQALNRAYRGKDKPTNVLSFPQHDPEEWPRGDSAPAAFAGHLGDIAIARETVSREAAERGVPEADHLRHLIVHGVLHLLGWDHANDADARAMESLETRILARLGVADPYAETEHAAC